MNNDRYIQEANNIIDNYLESDPPPHKTFTLSLIPMPEKGERYLTYVKTLNKLYDFFDSKTKNPINHNHSKEENLKALRECIIRQTEKLQLFRLRQQYNETINQKDESAMTFMTTEEARQVTINDIVAYLKAHDKVDSPEPSNPTIEPELHTEFEEELFNSPIQDISDDDSSDINLDSEDLELLKYDKAEDVPENLFKPVPMETEEIPEHYPMSTESYSTLNFTPVGMLNEQQIKSFQSKYESNTQDDLEKLYDEMMQNQGSSTDSRFHSMEEEKQQPESPIRSEERRTSFTPPPEEPVNNNNGITQGRINELYRQLKLNDYQIDEGTNEKRFFETVDEINKLLPVEELEPPKKIDGEKYYLSSSKDKHSYAKPTTRKITQYKSVYDYVTDFALTYKIPLRELTKRNITPHYYIPIVRTKQKKSDYLVFLTRMFKDRAGTLKKDYFYSLDENIKIKFLEMLRDFIYASEVPGYSIMIRFTELRERAEGYDCRYTYKHPQILKKEGKILKTWQEWRSKYEEKDNPVAPCQGIEGVAIVFFKNDENRNHGRDKGNFFPFYLNETCSELFPIVEKLDIYTPTHWKPKENCFIIALTVWNQENNYPISNEVIKQINYRLIGKSVEKAALIEIGKEFKILFELKRICFIKSDNKSTWSTKTEYCPPEKKYQTDKEFTKVSMGLFLYNGKGHYFADLQTPYTISGIENYKEIKILCSNNGIITESLEKRLKTIYVQRNNRGTKIDTYPQWRTNKYHSYHPLTTTQVIHHMMKTNNTNNFFSPIPNCDLYRGAFSETRNKEIHDVILLPTDCRKIEYTEKKSKKRIFLADTECTIHGRHYPYALAYCPFGKEYTEMTTYLGKDCIQQFMKDMQKVVNTIRQVPLKDKTGKTLKTRKGKVKKIMEEEVIIYFHNLSYDGRLFVDQNIYSVKKNGNKLIEMKLLMESEKGRGKKLITLRDSYMLIPNKLANFPAMFGTEEKEKKQFPYSFITMEMVEQDQEYTFDEIVQTQQWDEKEKKLFRESLVDGNFLNFDTGKLNVRQMITEYVESDVRILSQGMTKYQQLMKTVLNMDPLEYISISSLAYNYLKRECFVGEDIYEYTGETRDFIRQACSGGRCMSRENKSYLVCPTMIDDFDACSLYPSAMSIMKIPKGTPKPFRTNLIEGHFSSEKQREVEEKIRNGQFNGAIVRIRIKSIGRELAFPLIYTIDKNKTKVYENKIGIEMIIDDVYLMELIKWQQIEYEMLECIYWNEGSSDKLNSVIVKLYKERQNAKDPSIKAMYKLILNSSYGKTIEKPKMHKYVVVKEKNYKNHYLNNFINITDIEELCPLYDTDKDDNTYIFKEYQQIDDFHSPTMIGVRVLSTSKKLMNQVMVPAELEGLTIFYQDTDSMHIFSNEVPLLEDAWRKHNGFSEDKKLIGSDLCQFHSDFPAINGQPSCSIASIFLGKKMYVDLLVPKDGDKPKEVTDKDIVPVIRMKGISEQAIRDYDGIQVTEDMSMNDKIWEIYNKLFNNEMLTFDLAAGKGRIKFDASFKIETINQFKRKIMAPMCNRITYDASKGEFKEENWKGDILLYYQYMGIDSEANNQEQIN